MSDIFIGTYKLGLRLVRLYGTEGGNGKVQIIPDDGGTPVITIGFDNSWSEVVGTLLHEVYELSLIDLGTRWGRSPSYTVSAADYLFVATHEQLGEIHERIGFFLVPALVDLSRVYNERVEIIIDKDGHREYKIKPEAKNEDLAAVGHAPESREDKDALPAS